MSEAPAAADVAAMARLGKALIFLRGVEDPTTIAVEKAAASGKPEDIRKARTLFSRLKPGDRAAALAMIAD